MGGNLIFKTSGDILLKAGHTMPQDQSYRIDYCALPMGGGLAGGQDYKNNGANNFPIPFGTACNSVKRLNIPPRAGAGTLSFAAGNGISFTAGSPQGIDFVTSGHFSVNAPTAEIPAVQLSLGSDQGQTTIAGNSLSLLGKAVNIGTQVEGEQSTVFIRGGLGIHGDAICNGSLHGETVSCVTLAGVKEKVYIGSGGGGSGTNTYGGPAFWGGPAVEGIIAGLRQVTSYFLMQGPAHPKFFQQLTSPRYWLGGADAVINAAYSARPIELPPTGLTFTLGFIPGLVWNWPHIHAVPDDQHFHEHDQLKMELYDDSRALRKAQVRRSAQPSPKKYEKSILDIAQEFIQMIAQIFTGAWNQIGTFIK
jgi:hypothetical protein